MRDFKGYIRQNLPSDLRDEERLKIVEELAVQLEEFYTSLLQGGLDEDAAWDQTTKQIPSWTRLVAELAVPKSHVLFRDNRRENLIDSVFQDLQYAFRQLRNNPAFAVS